VGLPKCASAQTCSRVPRILKAGITGKIMHLFVRTLVPLIAALSLAACGGGKDSTAPPAATVPTRGVLLQKPPVLVSTESVPDVLSELSLVSNAQILTLGGNLLCDVAVYHIEYTTVGGANEATMASGTPAAMR